MGKYDLRSRMRECLSQPASGVHSLGTSFPLVPGTSHLGLKSEEIKQSKAEPGFKNEIIPGAWGKEIGVICAGGQAPCWEMPWASARLGVLSPLKKPCGRVSASHKVAKANKSQVWLKAYNWVVAEDQWLRNLPQNKFQKKMYVGKELSGPIQSHVCHAVLWK